MANETTERFNPAWIELGITDACVKHAEEFAKKLVPKSTDAAGTTYGLEEKAALTSSQIRISFGEVRRIQQRTLKLKPDEILDPDSIRSLALLRPKLAYATARAKDKDKQTGADLLEKELTTALDYIRGSEKGATRRFQNFCDYFEAILAYHKKFGGKD